MGTMPLTNGKSGLYWYHTTASAPANTSAKPTTPPTAARAGLLVSQRARDRDGTARRLQHSSSRLLHIRGFGSALNGAQWASSPMEWVVETGSS
jgi:hypothetical protein